jgi:hypothetical protein
VIVIEAGAANLAPLIGEVTVTVGPFARSAAGFAPLGFDAAAAANGCSTITSAPQTVIREFRRRRFPISILFPGKIC